MILATAAFLLTPPKPVENPGQMYVVGKAAPILMPLERTSIAADVSGMGARVTVKQTFVNPSSTPIEAVYKFPLPHDAAVDRMRIRIGTRVIEGAVMRREAAKVAYEAAKAQGKAAALLDQETDDVFTQSVANVMPGRKIEVEISYVQVLKFENGEFEFAYPMVVGPRYLGAGTPHPERLATPTLPPGIRSGANVDLAVTIHGGAPIREFRSVLHEVRTTRPSPDTVRVELARKDEIPNRDFVLRYRTATTDVQEAAFTSWDPKTGGHFALVLAPPPEPAPEMRSAKEMTFVIDQSGSQSGFPIDKSKELALELLKTMGPQDTFNVMGFSNEVNPLWPEPRPNTPDNVAEAKAFITALQANGGTELEKAIVASLSPAPDPARLRIVLFNTDGYAGQESTILSDVQKYRGTSRLFTFGVGNSVNRGLINAMSVEGRGAAEIVTLAEDSEKAKERFAQRLENPLLVNPAVSFQGGSVADVTPTHLPDVFSAKPVVVYGRYTQPGRTRLTLTGRSGGHAWSRTVDVNLPGTPSAGSSVASLWARAKLAEMKGDGYAAKAMGGKPENEEAMTKLALDYGIMSETTSFVAIDRSVSNESSKSTTVSVPTEMPSGVTMGLPAIAAPGGTYSERRVGGGMGGGGFAQGKVFAGASANATSTFRGRGGLVPQGIDFVSYDPTDNSLVVMGDEKNRRTVAIGKGLLDAKGKVAVRVWVKDVNEANLVALRKAGLKVGSYDGATLVFGTADAATIRAIAKLAFVERIAPLH